MRWLLAWLGVYVLAIVCAIYFVLGSKPAESVESRGIVTPLFEQAQAISEGLSQVEDFYSVKLDPVVQLVESYNGDLQKSRQIAFAVYRASEEYQVDMHELLGMIYIESGFDDRAVSFMGAKGLLQIMDMHRGQWGCGKDHFDIQTNVCLGAKIYRSLLDQYGDKQRSLLAYNGCVRGTNTPDCHTYPAKVERRTRWIRQRLSGTM